MTRYALGMLLVTSCAHKRQSYQHQQETKTQWVAKVELASVERSQASAKRTKQKARSREYFRKDGSLWRRETETAKDFLARTSVTTASTTDIQTENASTFTKTKQEEHKESKPVPMWPRLTLLLLILGLIAVVAWKAIKTGDIAVWPFSGISGSVRNVFAALLRRFRKR